MNVPVITGPSDFDVQVIGQRRRQEEFVRLCGPHRPDGHNTIVRAYLALDEQNDLDSMAVSVRVDGLLVGYLPMDMALEFRRAVIEGDLSEFPRFDCAAAITGGRKMECGANEDFRISIDLPQDAEGSRTPHLDRPKREAEVDNPLIGAFRSDSLVDRQIDELIGIVKGVTADGIVSQAEVEYLLCWMDANRRAANQWPAKVIYPRLVAAIHGGSMSIEKEGEILDLLLRTVGGNTSTRHGQESDSTKLPYIGMESPVAFMSRNFCFTGVFASGSRVWCHDQVADRGGCSSATINKKLHYLVIGDVGNQNWLHSTHGRKIEKAIQYNSNGCSIAILSEEFWHSHL